MASIGFRPAGLFFSFTGVNTQGCSTLPTESEKQQWLTN
jgi:hypothetical protein